MRLKYMGHKTNPVVSIPFGVRSKSAIRHVKADANGIVEIPDKDGEALLAWQEKTISQAPMRVIKHFNPHTQKLQVQHVPDQPHGEAHRKWVLVEESEAPKSGLSETNVNVSESDVVELPKKRGRKKKAVEAASEDYVG